MPEYEMSLGKFAVELDECMRTHISSGFRLCFGSGVYSLQPENSKWNGGRLHRDGFDSDPFRARKTISRVDSLTKIAAGRDSSSRCATTLGGKRGEIGNGVIPARSSPLVLESVFFRHQSREKRNYRYDRKIGDRICHCGQATRIRTVVTRR